MPHLVPLLRALARSTRASQRWQTLRFGSEAAARGLSKIGKIKAAKTSRSQAFGFELLQEAAETESGAARTEVISQIRELVKEIRPVHPKVADALKFRAESLTGALQRVSREIGTVEGQSLLGFRLQPQGNPDAILLLEGAISTADNAIPFIDQIILKATTTIRPRRVSASTARAAVNEIDRLELNASNILQEAENLTNAGSLVEVKGNVGRIEQAIAPVPSPFTPPAELKLQQLEAIKQARVQITRQFGPSR